MARPTRAYGFQSKQDCKDTLDSGLIKGLKQFTQPLDESASILLFKQSYTISSNES